MKALIGERPNAKPVGIGNSTSKLDLDVLTPGARDDASGPEDAEPIMLSDHDDDEEDDQHRTQNKHSASVAGLDEDTKPKPETPACPNMSKPTTTGTKPKKLKGFEELVEITMAEEATRQKELNLKIQKLKDKTSRIMAKADLQRVAIEAKAEKVKHAHEMEMMKLQVKLAKIHQATPGIGTGVSGSVHSPGLDPAFSPGFTFGDGSQFEGMTGGNGSAGQGNAE